ncbi:uncharacterized protein [Macrobrachium rosenbergii]|uniref:uncharacterized protein n=1 Tax=Macrobrachium rosenbergii TaxID=79674 RepID=UPI0034D437C5
MIHDLSHPSGGTTAHLMTNKFIWHSINKDVHCWARNCIACQTSKTSRHTESEIGEFPQPRRRFSHMHVDVVGPPPQSGGARYLLTIIDHSTHWPKATPMVEASTTSCAEALLSSWISRFRVTDSITTDRGSAFLSELWVSLECLMGTKLHSAMAYNPTANGMIERDHRSLKATLMARCTDKNWNTQLPWVLLGLHTAPKADGNASLANKVYGETLVVPGEFFPTSAGGADMPLLRLREFSRKFAPCHRTFTDRTSRYKPPTLGFCAYVFVMVDARRPPLMRPYRGPPRSHQAGA